MIIYDNTFNVFSYSKVEKVYIGMNDNNENADNNIIWSSSDNTIAEVGANGVVKGYKAGKVTITAISKASSDVKAEKIITVKEIYQE